MARVTRMQMEVLCGSSLPAWKKKTLRLDLYLFWLIVQILITFSQVLASYLARYVKHYLTCVFVV